MNVEFGPTTAQLEAMRTQVLAEIAAYGKDLPHFLANFRNWLRPARTDNGTNYRFILENLGRLNRTSSRHSHIERIPRGERIEDHSGRWLSETDMQFLYDVNKAMETYGINPEKVQQLDEYAAEKPADYEIVQLRLAEYIFPAYIHLRAQEYTHQELTA